MTKMQQDTDLQCPLCQRTFTQETTRKRHFYYCRSKQPDVSRKRSCFSCTRAKTRCVWPAYPSPDSCNRCRERGAKCEYDKAVRSHGRDTHNGQGIDSAVSGPDRNISREVADVQPMSMIAQTGATTPEFMFDGSRDSDMSDKSLLTAESDSWDDAQIAPWDMLAIETCLSALRPPPLSSTSLFNTRSFVNPSHAPSVSLAMRMLRSYPSMVAQKTVLPPFINPQLYSRGKATAGVPLQALATCFDFVHRLRSPGVDKSSLWNKIWFEQERISAEHSKFNRWELLAALQALLIYCLLRLKDTPAGHNVFDASLLTTVNLISSKLAASSAEICDFDLSDDPRHAWREWIFGESRRRTVLIFQILNMLVDISTTVSSYSIWEFIAVPLPSPATLWGAVELNSWSEGFAQYRDERTLYGLSETGGLKRIKKDGTGLCLSSPVEWEDWSAVTGDVGTLVMVVGTLL